MDLETAIMQLTKDPSCWSGFDAETQDLLIQQAKESARRLQKEFDPATGERTFETVG